MIWAASSRVISLTADPLKDIGNTQKLDLVIYAGKSFKPTELLNVKDNSQ